MKYNNLTKKQLVAEIEKRDKSEQDRCKCITTREYEGGYGMRTIFINRHPNCPVHS